MRLRILFIYIIATFLISSVTFGEIVQIGEDGNSSAARCQSGRGWPYFSQDDDSGWQLIYTTESGDFDWSILTKAQAGADVIIDGGESSALGVSEATASSPYGQVSSFASVFITQTGSADDGPYTDSDSGTNEQFDAYEHVYGEHVAIVITQVEEGSISWAQSIAWSSIQISLE